MRIENEGEKIGEKIDFMSVWLERMREWKIGRTQAFFSSPTKILSPQFEEKIDKK